MNITTDKRMQEIARIAYHAQSFRPEDSKPEVSVIADLKRMAFKWSPSNKCWQRKITANAMSDTRQYFKIF